LDYFVARVIYEELKNYKEEKDDLKTKFIGKKLLFDPSNK